MLTVTESRSIALLPNRAVSPELPSKKDIRLEAGDYVVRLALSEGSGPRRTGCAFWCSTWR
ncbi:hypothetical protein RBB78_18885 [Tunturiibacter empetritectus]|uniref:hypothetical protein n=1 Tax=Tunturiibacter empetritectus TaxID=3069691 RepID=UPI003D9B02EA